MEKKWDNRSSVANFWAVSHPGPIFWLVVESIFLFKTGKFHIQWIMQTAYVRTEWVISNFRYFHLFTIHCTLGPALFLGFSIPLFFFGPFIVFIGCMVHVHSIKYPFHFVLGAPPQILAISSNILLWFIDMPGFKIVKFLNVVFCKKRDKIGHLLSFVPQTCFSFWPLS